MKVKCINDSGIPCGFLKEGEMYDVEELSENRYIVNAKHACLKNRFVIYDAVTSSHEASHEAALNLLLSNLPCTCTNANGSKTYAIKCPGDVQLRITAKKVENGFQILECKKI